MPAGAGGLLREHVAVVFAALMSGALVVGAWLFRFRLVGRRCQGFSPSGRRDRF